MLNLDCVSSSVCISVRSVFRVTESPSITDTDFTSSTGTTGEDTRIVIDNKSLSLLHIRYVDGDRISPGFTDKA